MCVCVYCVLCRLSLPHTIVKSHIAFSPSCDNQTCNLPLIGLRSRVALPPFVLHCSIVCSCTSHLPFVICSLSFVIRFPPSSHFASKLYNQINCTSIKHTYLLLLPTSNDIHITTLSPMHDVEQPNPSSTTIVVASTDRQITPYLRYPPSRSILHMLP